MSDILVHTSKSVYVGFSIFARTHAYDRVTVGVKVFCWLTQVYSITRLITTFLTILCLLLVRLVLLVSLKLLRNNHKIIEICYFVVHWFRNCCLLYKEL